mmetsp:Transcript_138414/g.442332  ORF Transcript_138414/g.442332 Transcript_138414/m.442332 type:complete len:261 (-) Transcript_138414:374-1156(-)
MDDALLSARRPTRDPIVLGLGHKNRAVLVAAHPPRLAELPEFVPGASATRHDLSLSCTRPPQSHAAIAGLGDEECPSLVDEDAHWRVQLPELAAWAPSTCHNLSALRPACHAVVAGLCDQHRTGVVDADAMWLAQLPWPVATTFSASDDHAARRTRHPTSHTIVPCLRHEKAARDIHEDPSGPGQLRGLLTAAVAACDDFSASWFTQWPTCHAVVRALGYVHTWQGPRTSLAVRHLCQQDYSKLQNIQRRGGKVANGFGK